MFLCLNRVNDLFLGHLKRFGSKLPPRYCLTDGKWVSSAAVNMRHVLYQTPLNFTSTRFRDVLVMAMRSCHGVQVLPRCFWGGAKVGRTVDISASAVSLQFLEISL